MTLRLLPKATMTNRLDQIITRTGDNGTSSLADGTRLSKAHPRFDAMGDVDELNSNIGVLRSVLDAPIDAVLNEFILPSGTVSATQAHICRSIARRAERALVLLNQTEAQNDASLKYLNRCSDVFFIMARLLNQNAQVTETYWRGVDK